MLQTFVNELPEEFCKYFEAYYLNRVEKWALCYRDPELPDTTAHPESFHRLLKLVYMEGTNCMDALLGKALITVLQVKGNDAATH